MFILDSRWTKSYNIIVLNIQVEEKEKKKKEELERTKREEEELVNINHGGGGVLDTFLGGKVQPGPSYPNPV